MSKYEKLVQSVSPQKGSFTGLERGASDQFEERKESASLELVHKASSTSRIPKEEEAQLKKDLGMENESSVLLKLFSLFNFFFDKFKKMDAGSEESKIMA